MIEYLKWYFGFTKCDHEQVRCIHGDEIVVKGWQRAACIDCFSLFAELPDYCYYTGELHPSKGSATL